jgi:dTDP-4-amino-4,6-dideoxygalactose transaminase
LIPFNIPYYSGAELSLIKKAMKTKTLTGDLPAIRMCEAFLEKKYNFPKVLLTNSCTMALEMAAVLIDIQSGDEIIMPSFTFVSSANAFVLRGAKIIFADSKSDHPNIDEDKIEKLISGKTRAILVMHYGGVAVDMDKIKKIARKNNLYIIEDAAQCIDAFYKGQALGSIGDIGCFSFHETKNIHCGEGGFLSVNNDALLNRAETIRNKGTNRAEFLRGNASKYEWMDIGFSSIPSAITAAFLFSQLKKINEVQKRRKVLWNLYSARLMKLINKGIRFAEIPEFSNHNSHIFFIICRDEKERNDLINYFKKNHIQAVFHYQSLHNSPFYRSISGDIVLPNADKYSSSLIRLPLYYDLSENEIELICSKLEEFYSK